jgi:type I restriction enzyme M protein
VKRLWGKLFGQEKNLTTSSIVRMNLFLHGIEDFQIVRGDTLRNPAFFEGDRLANFDCVIANPAVLSGKVGRGTVDQRSLRPQLRRPATVEQRRLRLGAAHGQVNGRGSPGAWPSCCRKVRCSAKGRRRQIRQKLLEMDLSRGGHRPGTQPVLWHRPRRLHSRAAQEEARKRRKKVLIADASRLFRRGRAQNFLEPSTPSRFKAGSRNSRMCRTPSGRRSRRDQGRGLDAQHLALRAATVAGRHPAAAGGHRGLQGCTDRLAVAGRPKIGLAKVMTEGGWLQWKGLSASA